MSSSEEKTHGDKAEVIKKISSTLFERRKSRNVTLEKASQATKIRHVFLKNLEEGEWDQLPGEVYIRGFVTRYAQFLGLKPQELLAPYFDNAEVKNVKVTTAKAHLGETETNRTPIIWGAVGIIALISLIQVIRHDRANTAVPPAPVPAQTIAVSTAAAVVPVEPVAPENASHLLQVFSPLPLWISVKTPSRSFEGFIPQNATWTWKSDGKFSIKLGYTQQVAMSFDGHPIAGADLKKRISLPNED